MRRSKTRKRSSVRGGGLLGTIGNSIGRKMMSHMNNGNPNPPSWPHNILSSAARVATPFLNSVAAQGNNMLRNMPQTQEAHNTFSNAQNLLQSYANNPQSVSSQVMSNPSMGHMVNRLGMHLPFVHDVVNPYLQSPPGNSSSAPTYTSQAPYGTMGRPQQANNNQWSTNNNLNTQRQPSFISQSRNFPTRNPVSQYDLQYGSQYGSQLMPQAGPQYPDMGDMPAFGGRRSRRYRARKSV